MGLRKFLFGWKTRSPDWWLINIIPIFLIGVIDLILFLRNEAFLIRTTTEQLLAFSVVLSSTDLGLRTKLDAKDTTSRLAPGFLVGISFTLLVTMFAFKERISGSSLMYIYLGISIFSGYLSLRMYDDNPRSYNFEPEIMGDHAKQEQEAEELFEPGTRGGTP